MWWIWDRNRFPVKKLSNCNFKNVFEAHNFCRKIIGTPEVSVIHFQNFWWKYIYNMLDIAWNNKICQRCIHEYKLNFNVKITYICNWGMWSTRALNLWPHSWQSWTVAWLLHFAVNKLSSCSFTPSHLFKIIINRSLSYL